MYQVKIKIFCPEFINWITVFMLLFFFPQIEAKTVFLRPTLSEVKPTNVNNKK